MLKPLYKSMIESNLNYISLSYFQWDAMYYAVQMNQHERLKAFFDELISYYPYVESVQIMPADKINFELYDIRSEGDKLSVRFKIYNDATTDYIKDKVVSATVDPQIVLESLMIDWIKISKTGKDFVFGLKYVPTRSAIDITSVLGSFLIAVLSVLYVLFNEARSELKIVRQSKVEEELQRKINQTILELSVDLLKHHENEVIYQRMLEKMIQAIPGAQGGSLLIRKDDRFEYVAAVGFDLNELSKVSFQESLEREWIKPPYTLKKKSDIRTIYEKGDSNLVSTLRRVGRIDEIMCTVSVPIEIEKEVVAIINFDNFSDENAFSESSVEFALLFANYMGVIFERIQLEKRIKEQNEELVFLSSHDPLTGLLNRRAFGERADTILALAKRENKKASLFFVDLNNFKQVNDRYGHSFGDEILGAIGPMIKGSVRKSDLVARIGGDEFVILAYDCAGKDALNLAKKIAQSVEGLVGSKGELVSLGVSIGIATYPDDAQDLDGLIRLADMDMYRFKQKIDGPVTDVK